MHTQNGSPLVYMTRGRLPQRAGSLCLNGGGAATAVPPTLVMTCVIVQLVLHENHAGCEQETMWSVHWISCLNRPSSLHVVTLCQCQSLKVSVLPPCQNVPQRSRLAALTSTCQIRRASHWLTLCALQVYLLTCVRWYIAHHTQPGVSGLAFVVGNREKASLWHVNYQLIMSPFCTFNCKAGFPYYTNCALKEQGRY